MLLGKSCYLNNFLASRKVHATRDQRRKKLARRSTLYRCIRCRGRAELGVYLGFYVFGSGRYREQKKGTLPARGYCGDCFMELVTRRGLGPISLESIRWKL